MKKLIVLGLLGLACVKQPPTSYAHAIRQRDDGGAIGTGNHIVTIRANDSTSKATVKDYVFRRANELCPQGWTTQADLNDLDIDDDGDNDDLTVTIDVACKTLLTIPAQ